MQISIVGLKLIRDSEGCVLTAYRDSGGVLTIGTGHTGPDVTEGLSITLEQAEDLLLKDLGATQEAIAEHVTVPVTQSMWDALCSFVFNVGAGNFSQSTLLRLLNQKLYDQAAEQFGRWVHDAAGHELPGLVTRRAKERELFLSQGEA